MRKIGKYRGQIRKTKQWVYGYLVYSPSATSYCIVEIGNILPCDDAPLGDTISVYHEVEYKSIGEYTGLVDKNGKEIYEGDIFYEEESHTPMSEWGKYYVVYDNSESAFMLQYENHDKRLRYKFNALNIGNIIGNIYENNVLIENKQNNKEEK